MLKFYLWLCKNLILLSCLCFLYTSTWILHEKWIFRKNLTETKCQKFRSIWFEKKIASEKFNAENKSWGGNTFLLAFLEWNILINQIFRQTKRIKLRAIICFGSVFSYRCILTLFRCVSISSFQCVTHSVTHSLTRSHLAPSEPSWFTNLYQSFHT